MFLILGRKSTLFARTERIFPATVHRVAIPAGVPRNQLLFFMDVRQ